MVREVTGFGVRACEVIWAPSLPHVPKRLVWNFEEVVQCVDEKINLESDAVSVDTDAEQDDNSGDAIDKTEVMPVKGKQEVASADSTSGLANSEKITASAGKVFSLHSVEKQTTLFSKFVQTCFCIVSSVFGFVVVIVALALFLSADL